MKRLLVLLLASVGWFGSETGAWANPWVSHIPPAIGYAYTPTPYRNAYAPPAPDACGPGFYCLNKCGCVYGPNWCVRPPFPPHNGFVFGPGGPNCFGNGAGGVFSTPPFTRSPRDFFMEDVP